MINFENTKKAAQGLVEYALILALVTVIAITALSFLGGKINKSVQSVGNTVETAGEQSSNTYCQSINMTFDPATGGCK